MNKNFFNNYLKVNIIRWKQNDLRPRMPPVFLGLDLILGLNLGLSFSLCIADFTVQRFVSSANQQQRMVLAKN